MNDSSFPLPDSDQLLAVELQIARRADELARCEPTASPRHALELWRQAEEEVWIGCWRGEAALTH